MQHLDLVYGDSAITVQQVAVVTKDYFSEGQEHNHSLEYFRDFPTKHGWEVTQSHEIKPSGDLPGGLGFAELLQSWLFFGLIYTVVKSEDGPLIEFKDLTDSNQLYVTTKGLPDALETWEKWEKDNPKGAKLRLIRAD